MDGEKIEGADRPRVGIIEHMALDVWNLMGGEIVWQAMPWIAEWQGCDDFDSLMAALIEIRDNRAKAREQ